MLFRKRKKPEGWYRPRGYAHFDRPISKKRATQLVEDPVAVAQHPFYPFIKRIVREKRFKADAPGQPRKIKPKLRPISYASHIDSHVFSYYAHLLRDQYEPVLEAEPFGASVIAYRKLGKTNVHFAASAFECVRDLAPCVVLAFDVKSFFDTLDHELLKDEWCRLLGVERLPSDHFAVFRAITRYAYVKERRLRRLFPKHYATRWRPSRTQRRKDRKRKPPVIPAICTPAEFRKKVRRSGQAARSLIAVNDGGKGIPQGSPISALLANLYMRPFDAAIFNAVRDRGGRYWRYSDDLLIICPLDTAEGLEELIEAELSKRRLTPSPAKTERYRVERSSVGAALKVQPLDQDWNGTGERGEIQYLGFVFDGKQIRIRPGSLTRYYRRMSRAVRGDGYRVRKTRKEDKEARIRIRRLYRAYSHVGPANFVRYAHRASSLIGSRAIRLQLRKHMEVLQSLLHEHDPDHPNRLATNRERRARAKARRKS